MDSLDQQITSLQLNNTEQLSYNQKLEICANLLGYRTMPKSIDEFLDDPYYMGSISRELYPFWRDKLREIYPTPIHTNYPIIVFTGGIGTGKSTTVRFMAEYMKHRIACLKDPYKTFGFVPGKNIKFSYFHKTNTLAQTDFVDVMDKWEELSPYFKTLYREGSSLDIVEQVCDSIRSNNNIGSDVLFYNLSELNFISYDSAYDKLDQALKRFDSRFGRVSNYFGHVIIDTSSQGDDSIADDFINNNPYGDKVLAIHTNQWVVREHMNYYGQKGWFKVFCGDSLHQPFIVKPEVGKVITPDMDPDRIIEVPEELRSDFEFGLVTALQDKAGISITTSDKFFQDASNIKRCLTEPQFGADIVKFDFYDKSDKLIYRFSKALDMIPSDKIIYVRFDLGVVNDLTGLAIAYFDKWKVYDTNQNIKVPIIKVPLVVGIGRSSGEETSLEHIFEFCMDLNEKFEIGSISFDQFQSRMILQNLTREGIPNRYLSVDRTDEAYVYLKNLINSGYIHLPENQRLLSELSDLRRIGNKIDHTPSSSKDLSDAVAGCVFDLYQNIDKAGQLSNKYNVAKYTQQIIDRGKKNTDVFQDMLSGLYGE